MLSYLLRNSIGIVVQIQYSKRWILLIDYQNQSEQPDTIKTLKNQNLDQRS